MTKIQTSEFPDPVDLRRQLESMLAEAVEEMKKVNERRLSQIRPLFLKFLENVAAKLNEDDIPIELDLSVLQVLDDDTEIIGVTSFSKQGINQQVQAIREHRPVVLQSTIYPLQEFADRIESLRVLTGFVVKIVEELKSRKNCDDMEVYR
jgi:hypothetical protein